MNGCDMSSSDTFEKLCSSFTYVFFPNLSASSFKSFGISS